MTPLQREPSNREVPSAFQNQAFALGSTVDVTKTCEVLDLLDTLDDTPPAGPHRP